MFRLGSAWRLVTLLVVGLGSTAFAQERGFRLHRYEGTAAGTSTFLVDRPWYTSTRSFSVGLTFDYSHQPLRLLTHAIVGHVDIGFALADRVQFSAALPVTLFEAGMAQEISQFAPMRTIVGLGDPRVGFMIRVAGQSELDPISFHLGADVWIPVGTAAAHQGDLNLRLYPRAVFSGSFAKIGRWAFEGGFLYRTYSSYGPPELGFIAGSEVRAGLSIGASLANNRLYLGPEAQFSAQPAGQNSWKPTGMGLELLGGARYLIADRILVGVAAGTGFLGATGVPDFRGMVRIAWAPQPATEEPKVEPPAVVDAGTPEGDDPDGDGIPTAKDRCPYEPETKNGVRDEDGCPEAKMEQGSVLARVLAPEANKPVAKAPVDAGQPSIPDAGAADAGPDKHELIAKAFESTDSDGDGIADEADRCPVEPEDADEFEDEDGCPELDNDGDHILDVSDFCPDQAESVNGIDDADGCPDAAPDADGDQVADGVDRCPFEAENRNGVRDEDGCPEYDGPGASVVTKVLVSMSEPPEVAKVATPAEPARPALGSADSDNDGIKDEEDRCPATPEDVDGFEDEDGCREPDNDDDDIPDTADKCPDQAETINGFEDADGCPDQQLDVDGDGFPYDLDRCPLEPGIAPDGCPHVPPPLLAMRAPQPATPIKVEPEVKPAEPVVPAALADFDKDGIADEADPCPMSPEDKDDFEDEDGCPETDNDRDGIDDAKDKCPLVAETINGINDEDGCPDVGASAVTVEKDAVVIKGTIQFKVGSADLKPASMSLVKQVASTLKAQVTLAVEIQGHTDDVGNAAVNVKLSKKRAEAIRAVLIKQGVAPNRLIANGYGPTRPRASNKTPAGREQNRRVEFLIIGASK